MCQRNFWLNPMEPVFFQFELAKEWRADCQRMDCGAKVVSKAGQRNFRGTRAAADRVVGLDDEDRESLLCEPHGSRQAVRAGTDHDCIIRKMRCHTLMVPRQFKTKRPFILRG